MQLAHITRKYTNNKNESSGNDLGFIEINKMEFVEPQSGGILCRIMQVLSE